MSDLLNEKDCIEVFDKEVDDKIDRLSNIVDNDTVSDDNDIAGKVSDEKMNRLYNIVEVDILSEENMKFIHDNGDDLLFLSCFHENYECVKFLLKHGISPLVRSNGYTCFHEICNHYRVYECDGFLTYTRIEILKLLIEFIPDKNALFELYDPNNTTPLSLFIKSSLRDGLESNKYDSYVSDSSGQFDLFWQGVNLLLGTDHPNLDNQKRLSYLQSRDNMDKSLIDYCVDNGASQYIINAIKLLS